ncbi:MAG: tRNA (5-methylaminomethyl-2-thiouridine)(34)-methyltransferase MnmD [Salaquimonas sp.]|nr:tRNA (5-methylaminomethyl-2-thiouridine)(34)-methyltransferase MnmD [Salaquimonas sp.]
MTEDKSKSIDLPALDWIDGTIPFSPRFADTYYSKAGGLAEAEYVFIAGNGLPARWPAVPECTIAELGFGTGLNFLATMRHWRDLAPPGATLRYVSFEHLPLSPADMAKALSRWPELADVANRLASLWRPEFEILQVAFADKVELIVFMGDANIRLPQLELKADAWYLDGFAPSRNPELWSATLMAEVFAHTGPGGTFATYTAAGQVRRDLRAAGFVVERRPGFAGKREMLAGKRPA